MSRAKGTPKTGGRKAGTPNRITNDVRLWMYNIIQDNMGTLENDLKGMKADKRWAIIEKLLPYIVTKKEPNKMSIIKFPDGSELII